MTIFFFSKILLPLFKPLKVLNLFGVLWLILLSMNSDCPLSPICHQVSSTFLSKCALNSAISFNSQIQGLIGLPLYYVKSLFHSLICEHSGLLHKIHTIFIILLSYLQIWETVLLLSKYKHFS